MNALQINFGKPRESSLRDSVIEVINSRIQKADYELRAFMAEIQKPDQKPGRPNQKDTAWIDSQMHVFDIIENSSKLTTNLLYLRANLTEFNSAKVLHLISSSRLKDLSLSELKQEI